MTKRKGKNREANLAMFAGALHRSGEGKSLEEVAALWNAKFPDDLVDVAEIIREHRAAVTALEKEGGPFARLYSLELHHLGRLQLPTGKPGRPVEYPGLAEFGEEMQAQGKTYKEMVPVWNELHPDIQIDHKKIQEAVKRARKNRAK